MRNPCSVLWLVLLSLVVSSATACKVGDGGFDGSVFDDDSGPAADGGQVRKDGGGGDDGDASSTSDAGLKPDASTAGITPQDVPVALAHAACEGLTACRGATLLADYLKGEDCVSLYTYRQIDSTLHYLPDSIDAGRVVWSAASFDACTEALAALGCGVQTHRWPAVCEQALAGQVPLDGDCDIDFDCEGAAYCAKATADTCPGICSDRMTAGLPCERSRECADGLVCYQPDPAMPGTCTAPGAEGEDCSAGVIPCGVGFLCRTEGSARVCRSLDTVYVANEGDGCGVSGTLCAESLVCASMTASAGSCEQVVAKDAPCRRAQPNQCPRGQYCDAADPGVLGDCVDLPGADEPCLIDRSPACAVGHVCGPSDTCKPMRHAAESCESDSECYSGSCFASGATGSLCVLPSSCTQL